MDQSPREAGRAKLVKAPAETSQKVKLTPRLANTRFSGPVTLGIRKSYLVRALVDRLEVGKCLIKFFGDRSKFTPRRANSRFI